MRSRQFDEMTDEMVMPPTLCNTLPNRISESLAIKWAVGQSPPPSLSIPGRIMKCQTYNPLNSLLKAAEEEQGYDSVHTLHTGGLDLDPSSTNKIKVQGSTLLLSHRLIPGF